MILVPCGNVLCIQSKYSIPDKSAFDTIVSKFQDYYQKYYSEQAGPLFAYSGVGFEDTNVYFQIITAQNLKRIVDKYESSQFASLEFYNQLKTSKRIEVIDGPQILDLLRALYRKANVLPSNFTLKFETAPITRENVYIGILSSSELKRLYYEYGDALFYENIRDFLSPRDADIGNGGTAINEEIIKTVNRQQKRPAAFAAERKKMFCGEQPPVAYRPYQRTLSWSGLRLHTPPQTQAFIHKLLQIIFHSLFLVILPNYTDLVLIVKFIYCFDAEKWLYLTAFGV